MKIVVLDSDPAFGCETAPDGARGALDVSCLAQLGHLEVHANTGPEEVVKRSLDAEVLLTNKVVLGRAEMEQLPKLRLISVLATGVNVVDLAAARERGITVCNVPGYSTRSTAQHAIALLLELSNRVGLHAADVDSGGWQESESFSYFRTPLQELAGLVMGVVGYGAIGKTVAAIAQALGMAVLVHTRTAREVEGIRFVDKETLLRESDVVSLHCPLTDDTHHFIDDVALGKMKPSALLINVARGPVVDEDALSRALIEGRLGGAGLDVLSTEPALPDCPLLSDEVRATRRLIVTPHIAWASEAARGRLLEISARNVEAFQKGSPQNVVN